MYDQEVGLNLLQLLGDNGTVRHSKSLGVAAEGRKPQSPKLLTSADEGKWPVDSMSYRAAQKGLARDASYVPRDLVPEVERILAKAGEWVFDTFELADAS